MKLALANLLLKKPSLCLDDLKNYRSLSFLSSLSKLIERVVYKQLTTHLVAHNLYVPVQSAYQQNHSTETALLKIVNDLFLAVDNGKYAACLHIFSQFLEKNGKISPE